MVICSCNYIDTDDIRAVLNYGTDPNPQQVMNMLAWTPECKSCKDQLKQEIDKVIKEFYSVSQL
jgi:bacterioferritin-associated ferredoxin